MKKINCSEENKEDYKITGEFKDYYEDLPDDILNESSQLLYFIVESYDCDAIFGEDGIIDINLKLLLLINKNLIKNINIYFLIFYYNKNNN